MQDIVLNLASILKVSDYDIYFIAIFILLVIIFLIIWITKMYEVFFGMVLWIAIFIVFQFLLIPTCQSNLYVPAFINQDIAKFIVWSSIYLIFILSLLVPLNGLFNITEPKNIAIKIINYILLSLLLSVFYIGIIIGFIERSYIFNIDSVFMFIKKLSFWWDFAYNSKIYKFLVLNVPIITLTWIWFIIYKLVFSDLVNMLLILFFNTFKLMINKKWWWVNEDKIEM